jgi:hypothetical protein
MPIRQLFDPNKDISRSIEKVITYGANQEQRLKVEISEYVVTESMEEQLEKLLKNVQAAMDQGGQNEVGVWVSGFYGSGKSSFTKYLALAMDDSVIVDSQPFLKHFQDRTHKAGTKALLSTLASRFPAAVVMLDLASEQIAGATLNTVSTVLYYKVLQWAGYSRNVKIAAFERKLKKDSRYDEFLKLFKEAVGESWSECQDDQLVADSVLPGLAHKLYPDMFQTPHSFTTTASDVIYLLDDQVQEMLDIVREHSKKEHILFVIDEVGQYVGSNANKILDLQGLAENLKNIGDGKVWLINTAQQTLTEDDPRVAINSPELYKLKDRFPISVNLESRDIKEICFRRLLGKSTEGAAELKALFAQHGQALRQNTKLEDAAYYDSTFGEEDFVNLYPFLPAHFDILLHLLGQLAKSTGGVGLRSAIKVIQDILIDSEHGRTPVADRSIGWLATTVTLYDSLERDIERACPSEYQAVQKVPIRFTGSDLHYDVAKAIAVLQILGNIPITRTNVAGLMHAELSGSSRSDEISSAIDEMIADATVPLGEKEGQLKYFSERLNDIEQERGEIPLRSADTRRIFSESLRELFSPLPAARIHGSLAVTGGVKSKIGEQIVSLAGEREPIQTVIEYVAAPDVDTAKTRLVDESRQRSSEQLIYLLGQSSAEVDDLVAQIFRCERIVALHRSDPDQEIKEYCASQTERAARQKTELQNKLRRGLEQGTFVFRGQPTAVSALGSDLTSAAKKQLADAAKEIFNRYPDAPERVETAVAEKFLSKENLNAITSSIDPLGLVKKDAGNVKIDTDYKAIVGIKDYLDRTGTIEGKRLQEYFSGAPFGWSPDTVRYIVAAMLVAGEVKLKVSGREVSVTGQQAIDALKTNNTFKSVGVALREDRPSNEVLAKAAERLTELTGESVMPLEQNISQAAVKFLPQVQTQVASLPGKLRELNLPGSERVDDANQEVADLLLVDASDAPQRLGKEESSLYDGLTWAKAVKKSLDHGLEATIETLREHQHSIRQLPDKGVPGQLKADTADDLQQLDDRLSSDDFYTHGPDLNSSLTDLEKLVSDAADNLIIEQKERIKAAEQDLERLSEWNELTQEEQSNTLNQLDELRIEAASSLQGLQRLVSHEFDIQSSINDLKNGVMETGRDRIRKRVEEQTKKDGKDSGAIEQRSVSVPSLMSSTDQIDDVIRALETVKAELAYFEQFELRIEKD